MGEWREDEDDQDDRRTFENNDRWFLAANPQYIDKYADSMNPNRTRSTRISLPPNLTILGTRVVIRVGLN